MSSTCRGHQIRVVIAAGCIAALFEPATDEGPLKVVDRRPDQRTSNGIYVFAVEVLVVRSVLEVSLIVLREHRESCGQLVLNNGELYRSAKIHAPVVSGGEFGLVVERAVGADGGQGDPASQRVLAESGALGTALHFYGVHIEKVHERGDGAGNEDTVDGNSGAQLVGGLDGE